MEKFLFKTIELWWLLVALLMGTLLIIVVSWLAISETRGSPELGRLGSIAVRIASIPDTILSMLTAPPPQEARESRFPQSGFSEKDRDESFIDHGYLLLSYFSSDKARYVVDLIKLADTSVVRSYEPDIAAINARSKLSPSLVDLAAQKGADRYRMVHPFLTDDGGLLFQDDSPLVRVDACSNVQWTVDGVFHHSIEQDGEGNFWVPSEIWPSSIPGSNPNASDNAVTQISPSGRILILKSMAQIFIDNGMQWVLYGIEPYSDDPLHMNDIQPVLENGKYWNKGDIFISLRNRSMILLYRPSTNKVLWFKQGPWLLQHDVNILNDHQISVFDNNASATASGDRVTSNNQLVVFDFDTGETHSPYAMGFAKHDLRTITEGRGTVLANGDVFVEESDYGRALRMDPAGVVRWLYVGGLKSGKNSILGWSRYLDSKFVSSSLTASKTSSCEK